MLSYGTGSAHECDQRPILRMRSPFSMYIRRNQQVVCVSFAFLQSLLLPADIHSTPSVLADSSILERYVQALWPLQIVLARISTSPGNGFPRPQAVVFHVPRQWVSTSPGNGFLASVTYYHSGHAVVPRSIHSCLFRYYIPGMEKTRTRARLCNTINRTTAVVLTWSNLPRRVLTVFLLLATRQPWWD